VSPYDYLVVVLYLGLILGVGLVFRRFNKDSSDYFRSGGTVTWWMAGATAFMTQFSSWTFTGAAGKAYTDGAAIFIIYLGNALGYFIAFRWSAARFRQMRVLTPLEGVRERYGRGNERFFAGMWIPLGIFYAGIWLNAMSTFTSAVFGLDPIATISVVGLVILLTATIGGGRAVVALDFLQLIILFPVSLVVAVLALHAVGHGDLVQGVSRLATQIPRSHEAWTMHVRPHLGVFWAAATLLKQCCTTNNMNDANRFLLAADSTAARRAALMASGLFLVGPVIWFVPPIAAAILYPDLSTLPQLHHLGARMAEGAYVAIGLTTLPAGMIGLMAAAIFGVTLSSMDVGINKAAGTFIRSFYRTVVRPHANERETLIAGQVTSAVCGLLVIASAVAIQSVRYARLFDVMMLFSSMIVLPFILPLILGVIIKRTPDWSGWSTVCVGLVVSAFSRSVLSTAAAQQALGLTPPIRPEEMTDALFATTVVLNILIGSAWFAVSTLFTGPCGNERARQQDALAERMRTPVVRSARDVRQESVGPVNALARLCLPAGGFVMLLAAIPNPLAGRVSFVFVGAAVAGIGCMLRWLAASDASTAPPRLRGDLCTTHAGKHRAPATGRPR